MAKKKNYNSAEPKANKAASTKPKHRKPAKPTGFPPATQHVRFPENPSTVRTFDFAPHYGQGYDEITFYSQRVIEHLKAESIRTHGQTLSMTTIARNYCHGGLSYWFEFCQLLSQSTSFELTVSDINLSLIERFMVYLSELELSTPSQKTHYSQVKSSVLKNTLTHCFY